MATTPNRSRPQSAPILVAARPAPKSAAQSQTQNVGLPSGALLYSITIFLGAFLLFQVQLVLGKFVLPRFGGGPSVWSTSLLTFQFLLLGGYAYGAAITTRFSPRIQSRIHLGLLLTAAIALAATTVRWHSAILPRGTSASSPSNNPVLQILILLVTAVGLPCVLLSASSPLLQKWFSDRSAGASPYRLYALSNLGSMLGLLSYPVLVERFFSLSSQSTIWTVFYVLFLITTAVCAVLQRECPSSPPLAIATGEPKQKAAKSRKKPAAPSRILWLGLAACGSVMLLATTNLICQEVAVIPLLWVLPLSLYLLTFIICFDHARWYRREIFHPLYLLLALLSLRTALHYLDMSKHVPLLIFCATLFVVCMICHGELVRLKPEPRQLMGFYLMISAGGALGSAFVVLAAPHLFTRFWEFHIALIGCGVLLAIVLLRDAGSWVHQRGFGAPVFAFAALVFAVGAGFYTWTLPKTIDGDQAVVWQARNFFGVKAIFRTGDGLVLRNGRTLHGAQYSNPALRDKPTTYYRRESAIGVLLENYPTRLLLAPLRVGVIGMGAGTLAAYGHDGDVFRFYEIDPEVVGLSQGENPLFTFVKDSHAKVEIAIGDARILLQQELAHSQRQNFDVLVVDAFSGDAVPVHLLTREAMAIYLQHLSGPSAVIAFHVSNRSIDLGPVLAGLAGEYHLADIEVSIRGVGEWVLLSADPGILKIPALAAFGNPPEPTRRPVLWTDDYSNLYSVIKDW
jgi:hypothetical protein